VFCGIDWAEDHHDVVLIDEAGQLLAKRRIGDDPHGLAELTGMLAAAGDSRDAPIPVAIETPRGLLVASLRATGRPVYAINPMAAARYRERHAVSGKKSDHADAVVLANILRTDGHIHRQLPTDTDLVAAIAVLARAQQDATWHRTRISNELRSLLREYYPVFLDAFAHRGGHAAPEARAVLAIAATPHAGATLNRPRIAAALRRAGRVRGIDTIATELQHALRRPQLRQPKLVEQAMGTHALALLALLNTACANADQLAQAATTAFQQHPDYHIITSFPGLGELTGARILAELGDDRSRFADARSVKAYAGSAPITRASGRSTSVTHRRIKNDRLAATGWLWAFSALSNCPPAHDHYQRRRAHGDRHPAAMRHLFNRLIGCLHHCLATGQTFDLHKAFTTAPLTKR
jgi:transposase